MIHYNNKNKYTNIDFKVIYYITYMDNNGLH